MALYNKTNKQSEKCRYLSFCSLDRSDRLFLRNKSGESLRGIIAKVADYGLEVSEFELSYVHFHADTFGKSMDSLIPKLSVEYYHCCPSTRRTLVLNNPRRLLCH